MITYVQGNLFESPAQVLVNPVNTEGVMGRGLAKDFKAMFPEMFRQYRTLCEKKQFVAGSLWLYKTPHKWVLNFPTKTTWRQPSRLEYIDNGLQAFLRHYAQKGISSIAFPQLGCGNGELPWEQVQPLMERHLKPLPIEVYIHLIDRESEAPEHRDLAAMAEWLMNQSAELAFPEVWRDIEAMLLTRPVLRTLNTGEEFTVRVSGEPRAIVIHSTGQDSEVTEEELLTVWDRLRHYGLLLPEQIPNGLHPMAEYIVALLAGLPYCRVVRQHKDFALLHSVGSLGIQLVPPARTGDEEAELLPLAAAV